MKTKNKWLWVELLNGLANAIVVNFISLYIWQTKQSLSPILRYHVALFIGIPLTGIAASYISKKFNPKLSFILSFITRAILLISIIKFSDAFTNIPEVFGIVSALACGFFAIPKNIVFQLTTEGADREKQTAILTSGFSFIELLIPILGATWVYFSGSYNGVFTLAIVALIFSSLFLTKMSLATTRKPWDIKAVFQYRSNPDFARLLLIQFFIGIKNGIAWALFDVLIFYFLANNLPRWGITDSFLNMAGITGGIIYAKYIASKLDVPALIITSLLYTTANILFVTNYTFATLLAFLVLHSLAQNFLSSSLFPLITDLVEEDPRSNELSSEYYSILEFPLALGRVIPLVILLITNSSLDYNPTLKIIFLVIGIVPLIVVSILRKTRPFRQELRTFI